MEIVVAGSVAVDVATREDLVKHHDKLKDLIEERRPKGRYYMIQGSGTTTSGFSGSGPIAVSFTPQSPPGGRRWYVEWVAVWVGTNPATGATANLNAALMVGRCPTGPGAPIAAAVPGSPFTADVVVPGQPVPVAISVPDKTIVKPQQQLYVVLAGSGLAASTIYGLNAGVVDVPDTEETVFW